MVLKAILVECDPGNTLGSSCIRDVHNMASYLIQNGVNASDIIILLTDLSKKKLSNVIYSQSNQILQIFDSINLTSNDTLIVLLSGHGFTQRDTNGDEIDGMDEVINVGFIVTDDMIYEHLILKHNLIGTKMLLLADTCHSGTMYDLPYQYLTNTYIKDTKRNDVLTLNALSLSACSDTQLSMCDIGDTVGYGGSLTVALLENPDVMQKLISFIATNDDFKKIESRLKLLNQSMIIGRSINH